MGLKGIIDSWKRKFKPKENVQQSEDDSPLDIELPSDLGGLILEFEALCLRREILKDDQAELIQRLDDGKISAILFREEMGQYAQEAVLVTSKIELAKMHLADLGYRDIWV
ncbi:MAG: hypothetical protein ACTSV2_18930 [Candidatus Thorarchaeota archaeon]